MRTLLKVSIPVEKGNQAIQNGSLPKIMMGAIEDLKPEASYFFSEHGRRTALMVFDMKDSSQTPLIAERFFMDLHAEVTLCPVMNAEDLKKGLESTMAAKAMR